MVEPTRLPLNQRVAPAGAAPSAKLRTRARPNFDCAAHGSCGLLGSGLLGHLVAESCFAARRCWRCEPIWVDGAGVPIGAHLAAE